MQTCHKWNTSKTAACPLCVTRNEDDDHIYLCHHVDTFRVREKSINQVKDKLYAIKSKHDLITTILCLLHNCYKSPERDNGWMSSLSKELQTCVKYQSYIGWNNFMRGMLCHGWSDYERNLATVGDKHDPNKKSIWTTNIVEAIMQIGIDVWRERCTVVKAENTETHEKR